MSTAFADRCRSLLEELGLSPGDDRIVITPLRGGVSSDIGLVELGSRKLCVKFALAQLKVEESWFADTRRNQAEYEWLKLASSIAPDSVPELLGHSAGAGGFVMEYIDGPDVFLWKNALLQGQVYHTVVEYFCQRFCPTETAVLLGSPRCGAGPSCVESASRPPAR